MRANIYILINRKLPFLPAAASVENCRLRAPPMHRTSVVRRPRVGRPPRHCQCARRPATPSAAPAGHRSASVGHHRIFLGAGSPTPPGQGDCSQPRGSPALCTSVGSPGHASVGQGQFMLPSLARRRLPRYCTRRGWTRTRASDRRPGRRHIVSDVKRRYWAGALDLRLVCPIV